MNSSDWEETGARLGGRFFFSACSSARVAVICAMAVVGCSESEPVVSKSVATPTGMATEAVAPADAAPVSLGSIHLVDRAEFDALLAEHKGNVVLVDCWATWCLPCVEQLPHSAELAKTRGRDGLAVVALSFDDPESTDQVRKVLEGAGAGEAGVVCLQSKSGTSSESFDAFEITSGALPHYKLYDRSGKLHRTFELDPSAKQQFTPADIDAAVAELLAE